MADTIKSIFEGNVPTTSTIAYTVPNGKYAVIKSVIICNSSINTSVTFRLSIGGGNIAQDHTLKGGDTLVLDELDFPLLPGETIVIYGSTSSARMIISGFERDYDSKNYPYLKVVTTVTVGGGGIYTPANDFDAIIKSIVICNSTNTNATVSMNTSVSLINCKIIKPYDTLIVPLPKIFLGKGKQLYQYTTTATAQVTIIMEKVVQ
ncbi:hypothetical protein [Paenibacillus illinoisensis]|uniref:hypothetical protein n=1 Tax=Paenibacillus illinoisensis TaxID=59845 RepID=UPI00203ABEE9|nr:hypothetical protein [Paenibacillus illinoisensis]MCM3204418.1 hypothetical protein [Paenibacillus illinoisensis]